MNDLRKAAQMALDALERALETSMRQALKARIPECGEFAGIAQDVYWAATALRAALEQQQAEPVGEVINERGEVDYISYVPPVGTALYTSPQQQAEPVAWQVMVEDEAMKEFPIKDMAYDWCIQQKLSGSSYVYWIRPLYATPPQRKPLSDEQADQIISGLQTCHHQSSKREFLKVWLRDWAAHGIKEGT